MEDPQRQKVMELLRALITFGGSPDAPRDWSAQAFPDSSLNAGIGGTWYPPDPNEPDQTDEEDLRNKMLRKKFLMRQFKK